MRPPFEPYPYQHDGINLLLRAPSVALFDAVGVGKSIQVIHAACRLYRRGVINTLLVVAPASARSVWSDPDPVLGEVAKHMYTDVPYSVHEYSTNRRSLKLNASGQLPILEPDGLLVVVTNYEFIRRKARLDPLLLWLTTRKTMVVFDESHAIKTHMAQQTRACRRLAMQAVRRVVLNGTPGDPGNIFTQFWVMDPNIIGYRNFYQFRARHAIMGGYRNKVITGWARLDDVKAATGPLTLRRKRQVGLPPVYQTLTVTLTPPTWEAYKAMRDTLIVQLSSGDRSVAAQAGTKIMRLAQLTSGLLGGFEDGRTRIVGREKLDAVLAWIQEHNLRKLIVWNRWRAENSRLARTLEYGNHMVGRLYGSVPEEEKIKAKLLFAPGGNPMPAVLCAHPLSGGSALNLAQASVAIYMSQDYSLQARQQSEGRINRPGQEGEPLFIDVIAEGPKGEATIDRKIVQALRKKEKLEELTVAEWRNILESEKLS